MKIPQNASVAATYDTKAASGSQPRGAAPASPIPGTPSNLAGSDLGSVGAKDAARSKADSLELSSQGLRLSLTKGMESPPPQEPPPPEPEISEVAEGPPLLGAKESTWQSERKSKLDRLETLVRQGQYKVDPFILDELAVRMARLMN